MSEERNDGVVDAGSNEGDELVHQLEQARRAQAGSDKKVAELQKELDALKTEKGEDAKAKEVAEKERLLDRRERVMELAASHDLDYKEALEIMGLSGEADDEERIAKLAEYGDRRKNEAADEFRRKHGRRVVDTKRGGDPDLFDMSDREVESLSDAAFQHKMEAARRAGSQTGKRRSILDGLRGNS